MPHDSCEHTEQNSPSSSLNSPHLQSSSRASSLSPQSPVYIESFHWPDVQELRSKYSHRGPQPLQISRSSSVPDQILEAGTNQHKAQRSCSCSTPVYESQTPAKAAAASFCECQGLPGQNNLCKANSLDYMLGPLHLKKQQNVPDAQRNYYISGEATLPNDNKVIVVERIVQKEVKESDYADEERKEEADEKWDVNLGMKSKKHDLRFHAWLDSSRTYPLRAYGKTEQSLVKNLREKFQNLSSYT